MDMQPQTPPTQPSPTPSEPLPPHPAFATVVKTKRSRTPLWILLFVVLLAGGVYAYYWQHHKVTTLQAQLITTEHANDTLRDQVVELQQSSSSSTSTSKNVLKVSELGIQITLPSSLSDMTYAVTTKATVNGDANTSVGLSTLALITLDPKCNAATGPLGVLSKTNGTYPKSATAENSSGKLIKQYSGYYLAYATPQAVCSDIKAAQTATTADIAALPTWATAIQPLQ